MQDLTIQNRKPIWTAISEFYLDTELQDRDYDNITQQLFESSLTIQQLKDIDKYEVFPILQWNLLSTAGVWAAFDQEWLHANCQRNFLKRGNTIHRLKCRVFNKLFFSMRSDHWKQIEMRWPNEQ